MRVLLAEDEITIRETLADALAAAGHVVLLATSTAEALTLLEREAPDAVVTDIRMPGAGGMNVLERSVALAPERPVILMTGYATVESAVEAMRLGAVNYVQKPFRNESIVRMLAVHARLLRLEHENRELRSALPVQGLEGIVGHSEPMQAVFERVRTVAPSEATVLVQGESGTGKERIARAIHRLSPRREGPFVPLSCAALPESLLEAELFGHEKGAFTDARREKQGRLELADKGTLFLDDIDDMPLVMQVKLLRVLQEREFERIGGTRTLPLDIRVVAATKVPLKELVRQGRFREDLYYRIAVVPILLPPLRARTGDVPLLAAALIERHGRARSYRIARSTLAMMERYAWPGNVRELENAIQRAIALAGEQSELALEDLVPVDPRWRGAAEASPGIEPLRVVLHEAERAHLLRALEATGGHKSQTAQLLGISRKVLWEKLREHGLQASSPNTDEEES